jgi:hypothetical protein
VHLERHVREQTPGSEGAGEGFGAQQHGGKLATVNSRAAPADAGHMDPAQPTQRSRLDAERILQAGEQGIHLLFEPAAIGAAFAEDPARLRDVALRRRAELHGVLGELLALACAAQARRFIAALPPELRHVLVVLYFELLERRLLRRGRVLH